MADGVSKAVLITGCSSGIGRAAAERLAAAGWKVYATARRPETIADLAERGCETLALDVLDEDSMRAAVAYVEKAEGAVGALVNNAGYGQSGAVEAVPPELVRRNFETNLFGYLRMAQLVLPGMRRQGSGRIVNLSSVAGRVTMPGSGIYSSTKFAIRAMNDVLRYEVRGFGRAQAACGRGAGGRGRERARPTGRRPSPRPRGTAGGGDRLVRRPDERR